MPAVPASVMSAFRSFRSCRPFRAAAAGGRFLAVFRMVGRLMGRRLSPLASLASLTSRPVSGRAIPAVPLILPLAAAVFTACGPSPHEAGLTWNGKPLRVVERQEAPSRDSLRTQGWEALVNHAPQRILRVEPGEWGDSLWLLEFADEQQAYVAYQQVSADPDAVLLGETACGARVCFRRGRWIGAVDSWSWKKGDWFARALAMPDAPVPDGIPPVFGSLLHRNRVPGSERILTQAFMGHPVDGPVYAVKVDCRGDTAWLYAAPGLDPAFAAAFTPASGWTRDTLAGFPRVLEVASTVQELPPVFLRFSGRGMVGVEGCFDRDLTGFWLKMQARGLKKLK